jgi:predicted permease
MNEAVLKTITLILLIGVGLILKGKFPSKDKTDGIKDMILSVALPSTIFIALMKIDLDARLVFIPLIALLFNFFLYLVTPTALTMLGISKDSANGRTLLLLMPSLAPGMSTFPFIAEFLGEESLAVAAMADVGNKFFVLIFLYIVAMNMFMKTSGEKASNTGEKIKSLLLNLIKEPINIIIFSAIALLSFGWKYATLPEVVQGIFDKTSALMTPLVLIFIGLAVKFKKGNKRVVVSLLLFRAGISLLFSAALIKLAGIHSANQMLLAVALPLSSVSFWPFAHISLFNGKEEINKSEKRTFNFELAVMVLALSLPFSTTLTLTILSAGSYFADVSRIAWLGLGLAATGILPLMATRIYFQRLEERAAH